MVLSSNQSQTNHQLNSRTIRKKIAKQLPSHLKNTDPQLKLKSQNRTPNTHGQ